MNVDYASPDFQLRLFALSALIVSLAAYTALDLVRRRRFAPAGVCLGLGIWSLHVIGTSAFDLAHGGAAGTLLLPLAVCCFVAAIGLRTAASRRSGLGPALCGALLLGATSWAVYFGVVALRRAPEAIDYLPLWVFAALPASVNLTFLALLTLQNPGLIAPRRPVRLLGLRLRRAAGARLVSAGCLAAALMGTQLLSLAGTRLRQAGEAAPALGASALPTALFTAAFCSLLLVAAAADAQHGRSNAR